MPVHSAYVSVSVHNSNFLPILKVRITLQVVLRLFVGAHQHTMEQVQQLRSAVVMSSIVDPVDRVGEVIAFRRIAQRTVFAVSFHSCICAV